MTNLSTDTSERGLEKIIYTALTGHARNLLQKLRRSGRIVNRGARSRPEWVLSEAPRDRAKNLVSKTSENCGEFAASH